MADYVLSCESPIDLSPEMVREYDLSYISYSYELGKDTYQDDLFQSIPYQTFYDRMVQGDETKTFALNIEDYKNYFTQFLSKGQDVVHITLSGGLSSACQNACLAAEELRETYPDRVVRVVDGIGACGGFGLLAAELSDLKKTGLTVNELADRAEELKKHVCHLFFSTDLTFYIRGGRISKTAGVFATALSICPLCDMDDKGYLVVREKVRTKKKVKQRIVEKTIEYADGHEAYSGKLYVNHSNCKEDAEDVIRLLEERMPQQKGKIRLNPIGPTIGSHTGPGTVAVFFVGAERFPSEKSLAEN